MRPEQVEKYARALADSIELGDVAAAKRWKVSVRSLRRYRARSRGDSELAAAVRDKVAVTAKQLAVMRVEFMAEALAAMRGKLEAATLYECAGAMKIVGDLHTTASIVEADDDGEGSRSASEVAFAAEGRSAGATGDPDREPAARH